MRDKKTIMYQVVAIVLTAAAASVADFFYHLSCFVGSGCVLYEPFKNDSEIIFLFLFLATVILLVLLFCVVAYFFLCRSKKYNYSGLIRKIALTIGCWVIFCISFYSFRYCIMSTTFNSRNEFLKNAWIDCEKKMIFLSKINFQLKKLPEVCNLRAGAGIGSYKKVTIFGDILEE
nr:hypothetical protein BHI3_15570 [Bacteriovorax sp. HI3]